jgi:hypothetical protein
MSGTSRRSRTGKSREAVPRRHQPQLMSVGSRVAPRTSIRVSNLIDAKES